MSNFYINFRRAILNSLYQASRLFGLDKKTVSILCYHSFSPGSNIYGIGLKVFAKQMERIHEHARFVSLSEIVSSLENGGRLKGPAVAITFDDGYADVMKALPIIRKYKIPATIFVLADPKNANRKELEHKGKLFTWEQIKQLKDEGWTIGSHGTTHSNLTNLSDFEIENEVVDSKKIIERKLKTKVDYFAYPKGKYNQKITDAVKKAGYEAGFGVSPNCVTSQDITSLPRFVIDTGHQLSAFPMLYSYTTHLIRIALKKINPRSDRTFITPGELRLAGPNIFQLTIGLLVSIVKSVFNMRKVTSPKKINNYRLIEEVVKEVPFKEYGIGIYEQNGKKYFIKTWNGRIKDFNCYVLMNEYLINQILYEKFIESQKINEKHLIGTPKAIELIKLEDSVSLVFEYVNGKTLNNFPLEKRVEVLSKVLRKLNSISADFTEEEKKLFPKRTLLFYFLSLPFFTILTILSNPKYFKVVLIALIKCLREFSSIQKTGLFIAHRDIDLHNIILNKSKVFIVDCGSMVLTLPDYDITFLSIEENLKPVISQVTSKLRKTTNRFLENYILIQLANSYGSPKEFVNFYLKSLFQRYG